MMKKELYILFAVFILLIMSISFIHNFVSIVGYIAVIGYCIVVMIISFKLIIVSIAMYNGKGHVYQSPYDTKVRLVNIGWDNLTFWHNDPTQIIICDRKIMGVKVMARYNSRWSKTTLRKMSVGDPTLDNIDKALRKIYATYLMSSAYRVSEAWILRGEDEDKRVNQGVFSRLLLGIENISGEKFPNVREAIENYSLTKIK